MTEKEKKKMTEEEKKQKPPLAKRFRGYLPVVVDIETAGFNANTDAILEIAAVILGMDENENLVPETTVFYRTHPFEGANLEEASLKFIGIDPHHPLRIAHQETEAFKDIFKQIRQKIKEERCSRAILVGHNAHFDHGFVKAAVERNKIKRDPFHPFSSFDTASISALCYGQTVLSRACEAAEIEFDPNQAHSAKYDAEKTAELFCKIVNHWKSLGGWP